MPSATDSVIIASGHTLTLTASATCGGINIIGKLSETSTSTNYSLSVSGGGSTPVTKGYVCGNGNITSQGSSKTLTISLKGNWSFSGSLTGSRLIVTMNSTTVDQTISSAITCRTFTMAKGTTYLYVTTTPTASNSTTLTSGNVVYNGTSQNLLNKTHPGTVTLSGSGTKTVPGSISITGSLTINSSLTLALGTNALTLNSDLLNNSSNAFTGSGTVTLAGTGNQSI